MSRYFASSLLDLSSLGLRELRLREALLGNGGAPGNCRDILRGWPAIISIHINKSFQTVCRYQLNDNSVMSSEVMYSKTLISW